MQEESYKGTGAGLGGFLGVKKGLSGAKKSLSGAAAKTTFKALPKAGKGLLTKGVAGAAAGYLIGSGLDAVKKGSDQIKYAQESPGLQYDDLRNRILVAIAEHAGKQFNDSEFEHVIEDCERCGYTGKSDLEGKCAKCGLAMGRLQHAPDVKVEPNYYEQRQINLSKIDQSLTKAAMPRTPVVSSNVADIGYAPRRSRLEVGFKNGSVYQYKAVPSNVAQEFLNSQSKGKFLHQNIKGGYAYRQIKAPDGKKTPTLKRWKDKK